MTPSNRNDDESEFEEAVSRAVRKAHMEVANYSEGNHTFLKWVLGLCGGLTLAAVIGGITLYGKVSTIDERTQNMQHQADEREHNLQREIEELKQLVRSHP